jgi:hypothetical protein
MLMEKYVSCLMVKDILTLLQYNRKKYIDPILFLASENLKTTDRVTLKTGGKLTS